MLCCCCGRGVLQPPPHSTFVLSFLLLLHTHKAVAMGNVWAKKPLKEIMRENKRMITRAIRELDRERMNLERNEKKLIMDIKKYAKENQMGAVKTMAKDLVRTRYVGYRGEVMGGRTGGRAAWFPPLQGVAKGLHVCSLFLSFPPPGN